MIAGHVTNGQTTMDDVGSRLENAQPDGKGGFTACCPCHDSVSRKSLHVSPGDHGGIVMKCFGGCQTEDIVQAIGLTMSDLRGSGQSNHYTGSVNGHTKTTTNGSPSTVTRNDSRKFSSWREAADAIGRNIPGQRGGEWPYQDKSGREVGAVCRWDLDNGGKTIRQFSEAADGGWQATGMIDPKPIYRLPEVLSSTGPVWWTEGEKAADAARQIGLTASTSSGGANALGKTDISPLAGRRVNLWRDHDAPGLKYAEDFKAAAAKLNPVPTIHEIDPNTLGLKESEDAADWIENHDAQAPEDLAAELERIADESPVVLEPPKRFQIEFISSAEFAATDYRAEFIVKKLLVKGQPCIAGGAQKTLKTTIAAVDLAFSIGTGTRFLNHFDVPKAMPVGVISGESGGFTLQETARRVAYARGRLLSDAQVYWGFKLPQLGLSDHLKALGDAVCQLGLKVLIVDPAYLCMLRRDDGSNISFSVVFEMGDILARFNEAFAGLDCTPIILHHESKGASSFRRRGNNGPPELSDLSMAGFAEWARQWLLLGRREEYEHGSGIHRLWLNAGGSAGHGGLYAIDVDEGKLQDDFTGRKWDVTVNTPDAVRQVRQDATEQRKASREEEKDARDRQKLLEAYDRFPDGETARVLESLAKINHARFLFVNQGLLDDGLAEPVRIKKKFGEYDGFRLVPQDSAAERAQSLFDEDDPR